ncbi:M20 aminoacylase family protein [Acetobacter sp.]|uniref:M20 aminoacylase family protein n=1 Tax=Acetobacter sp. TaxID=440 RepID=UPI0039ED1B9D
MSLMDFDPVVVENLDKLTEFRRDLHAYPELLYDLPRTSSRVAEALRRIGCDEVVEGVGGTGIVATIRGATNSSGRSIGLRADMDALPVLETGDSAWKSRIAGRMHACGHDGHTTMLLGAAEALAKQRNFDGTVVLIFQPAEEGGAGARAMIEDGLFDRWPVDEVYAIHNRPGLAVGHFTIAPGPIMGSVDAIDIVLRGVGAHAAAPQDGVDPVPATAALIQAVQTIAARNIDPIDSAVVSITTIHGGDAFNVIPESIRLTGTVRTLRETVRNRIEKRLHELVEGISEAFGISGELKYTRSYPVTVNHPQETEYAAQAAETVAGPASVTRDMPPSLAGEDFAFMLAVKPGALINIGNGPSAGLHHPAYDFADEALGWGSTFWCNLVRQRLPLSASSGEAVQP